MAMDRGVTVMRRWWPGLVFPLITAALAIAVTFRWGPEFEPDSVRYLEVAQNIRNGEGITDSSGRPFTIQPPLYPALLALLMGLGLSA